MVPAKVSRALTPYYAVFLGILFYAFTLPTEGTADTLLPHQAAYRLSLSSKKNNAQIIDLNGVFTVRLERICNGWILAQKMSQQLDTPTKGVVSNDSSSAIMETLDGKIYRFKTRQQNGVTVLDISGDVKRGRNGDVIARYIKPFVRSRELHKAIVFPIEHTRQLIAAAKAGKMKTAHRVFDGFDGASGHFVTANISKRKVMEKEDVMISPLLKGVGWNIWLAYFPLAGETTAPEMEMSATLLENGIADNITYKYERFSFLAQLERVEQIESPTCK